MSLGKNIQYLRKQKRISQEQLAYEISVSRQTVSKWEADEIVPELGKLTALCDIFSCKLDALVREDMKGSEEIYSEITTKKLNGFYMARYVMITPNPENDVNGYMEAWAKRSGLLDTYPDAKRIGWDFMAVSSELQNRFGLRGYVSAYILPDGFKTECPGVEYAYQPDAVYAAITVYDPFAAAFERIPNGYKKILEHLQANGFKENSNGEVSCFEYVYEQNGQTCMDIYVNTNCVCKTGAFTNLSWL